MKEKQDVFDQLDLAYEPTTEAFHRRVQETLIQMKTESAQARPIKRIQWAAVLAAALMLFSAIAAAANIHQIIAFITQTMAKNWVLDDAQNMLHTHADSAALGDCNVTISEWMCDGETLYVSICLTDPALQNLEANTDYLGGVNHYALYHGPTDVQLSEGHSGSASWDFAQDDTKPNTILFTLEAPVEGLSDAFTVTIPVVCSEGTMHLNFDVHRPDFGTIRVFAPSAVLQAEGYTAQVTNFKATALRTYAALELVFDESLPENRRREIVSDYLDGLGVPEGKLNAVAGEGEEIVMAKSVQWGEDGLTCTLELRGNPREDYPDGMIYCPRWGMHAYEGEREIPPLSMDGAVIMEMKEVCK